MKNLFLELQGVSKNKGNFSLGPIDLSIAEGEFVCFLGPSGCGKTTLLRIIAGLDYPDSGKVVQNKRETTYLRPEKRDFGMVFQSYALFPNLSVEKNLAYGLKKMSGQEKRQRVRELLSLVGLSGSEHKLPHELSGGQCQRVALARALAPGPKLLLLDEPLSALDAKVREHLREELKSIHQRLKMTTIMVTHDQEEALELADRIVLLRNGHLVEEGRPQKLYETPRDHFSANFLGRINFFEASIDRENQTFVATAGDVKLRLEGEKKIEVGKFILGIRPEEIAIDSAQGDGGPNKIQVKIAKTHFFGPYYRFDVERGPLKLTLDLPSQSPLFRPENMGVGDEIQIVLPATKLKVFPREGEGPWAK